MTLLTDKEGGKGNTMIKRTYFCLFVDPYNEQKKYQLGIQILKQLAER